MVLVETGEMMGKHRDGGKIKREWIIEAEIDEMQEKKGCKRGEGERITFTEIGEVVEKERRWRRDKREKIT